MWWMPLSTSGVPDVAAPSAGTFAMSSVLAGCTSVWTKRAVSIASSGRPKLAGRPRSVTKRKPAAAKKGVYSSAVPSPRT